MAKPRTKPDSINRLMMGQQYKLLQIVEQEYTSSRMHDTQFAAHATEKLGFTVTPGNVKGCLEGLGIKNNLLVQREEAAQPTTRLDRVEARLGALEAMARELGWQI